MKPFSQPFTDTIRLIDPVIVKKIVDALRDPQNKQITARLQRRDRVPV